MGPPLAYETMKCVSERRKLVVLTSVGRNNNCTTYFNNTTIRATWNYKVLAPDYLTINGMGKWQKQCCV
jgi:hypothetical protein